MSSYISERKFHRAALWNKIYFYVYSNYLDHDKAEIAANEAATKFDKNYE